MLTPWIAIAAVLALGPYVAAAFWGEGFAAAVAKLPPAARILAPAVLCVPYALVAVPGGTANGRWLVLYALLPVAVAALLAQARGADPEQRGNWRDALVLGALGLAVDLRWFEAAWPAHLAVFNKVLLLDAGVYGFGMLRQLDGVGFDLRLKRPDLSCGGREFLRGAPVLLVLGLALGFLQFHARWPSFGQLAGGFLFTFAFIAVPEELFFRGWVENLLERRLGRLPALVATAAVFGLAHWNKRTATFNWQYVLLAAVAGVFYGRAWRAGRRVGASAMTHAMVDTAWSIWLR